MSKSKDYVNEVVKLKNKLSIFKNLDDEIIRNIITDVCFMQYKEDEVIMKEGEFNIDIHILLTGECKVIVKDKVVGKLKNHQVFGEFSPITHTPRSATIITSLPSTILSFKLNFEFLEEELNGYGVLYKNFVYELIEKLNMMNSEKS